MTLIEYVGAMDVTLPLWLVVLLALLSVYGPFVAFAFGCLLYADRDRVLPCVRRLTMREKAVLALLSPFMLGVQVFYHVLGWKKITLPPGLVDFERAMAEEERKINTSENTCQCTACQMRRAMLSASADATKHYVRGMAHRAAVVMAARRVAVFDARMRLRLRQVSTIYQLKRAIRRLNAS